MDCLLEQARQGDKSAESALIAHLSARFRLLAEQRVEDRDVAQDIAQEACLTVLDKYRTETFTKGFEPWAYGVLRMKIGNHYQKRSVRRAVDAGSLDSNPGKGTHDDPPGLGSRLRDCLKKVFRVNSRYARTLVLAYQGFEVDDICRRLKVTRQNHYSNLFRARTMLKRCLNMEGE